jgi:arsenate reductase
MTKENKPEFVTVYKAHGKLDAESIKGFLEAQDIPAFLDPNAIGQIYGLTVGDLGQVGVMVSSENEARARELLEAMESGEFEDEVLMGSPVGVEENVEEPAEIDQRKRVLFLCTGNSCRSQMAEAIVNHYLPKEWIAFSAGSEPSGYVHPMASQVIQDFGIVHEGYSKPVDEFLGQEFDVVITLCDSAREACPLWLKKGTIIHLGFADPALFEGTTEQKLQVFKDIFEAIRATIISYLEDLG